jgi:hypothetical protein
MNDHSYQAFREDIFRANVRSQTEIANELKASGARVAFLTPQPIEDKRPDPDQDPRNQSLRRFCDGLKELAANEGVTFIDQFDPYMAILLRERPNSSSTFVGGGDAVHPGPIGHTVMAWAVLKGMGAPGLVSRVTIDVSSGRVTSQGCSVEGFGASGNRFSFERRDDALPMPIDEHAAPALKLAPILEDLDRYELQVMGLPPGTYELSIDAKPVGTVSSEALAKGWNLASQAGPITQQAQRVLSLVFQKNNLYFTRWRNVQLYAFPDWARSADAEARRAAELTRLDQQIADTEAEIEAARKLSPHHFALKPATP